MPIERGAKRFGSRGLLCSDIDLETEVDFRCRDTAPNAPVLPWYFIQDDKDILWLDADFPEAPDYALVQIPLRF